MRNERRPCGHRPVRLRQFSALARRTLVAVVWANVDFSTYDAVAHPLHFWINDVGMVFFFALAGKEVFEATLPGGALTSGRQAMSPLGIQRSRS